MRRHRARCFAFFFQVCLCAVAAKSQTAPLSIEEQVRQEIEGDTMRNGGPAGIIPFRKAIDASVTTSSQHDSGTGWSSVLTPSVGYRLDRHFSFDAWTPMYMYMLTTSMGGTALRPTETRGISRGVIGDTVMAAHMRLPVASRFWYTLTPTVSAPTGDSKLGLGAGQVTYDFNNHFEAYTRFFPFVEAGIGDSSALVSGRVRQGQNSVGKVGHFVAGGGMGLPRAMFASVSVYEILPIGDQNVYSTSTVRKRTVTRVTGTTGLAEDNGFNASVDIPLRGHTVLAGYYNRSLRQHNDTVGFAFTVFARPRGQY